jgi:EAL domain-containing protein (putative c-di-GMP-specific phosphodiesterase class I)
MPISVNLSASSLLDAELVETLEAAAMARGATQDGLVLEITETALLTRPENASALFARLRRLGYRFSVDDFGTGYSSMTYLKQLPIAELKIDKSFVGDMDRDPVSAHIVESTIALAHNLDLKVVAEGIESYEVATQLAALGCDYGQGYLFAKAMPVDEFEVWLGTWQGPPTRVAAVGSKGAEPNLGFFTGAASRPTHG